APHHHQPAALEQLADQPDKEADKCAQDNYRDGAAERLRKHRGQRLITESANCTAKHPANCTVTPARIRASRPSHTQSDQQAPDSPTQNSTVETAKNVKGG